MDELLRESHELDIENPHIGEAIQPYALPRNGYESNRHCHDPNQGLMPCRFH